MMTSKIDDGGPAYPCPEASEQLYGNADGCMGMTLRDYFAAKALQGLLADPVPFQGEPEEMPDRYASTAYDYADAMIAARKEAS